MKKVFLSVLTVLLCLTAVLLTACGDSEVTTTGNPFEPTTEPKQLAYQLNEDGGTYKVVGIGTYEGKEIEIPSTYKGLPVTAIGDRAFAKNAEITKVTIPSGVTYIGKSAFEYCTGISGISIPEGTVIIGENAFMGCTKLASVNLPDSVRHIGSKAFSNCIALSSIPLNRGLLSIGANAFSGCVFLNYISIPDSVISVGSDVFSGCGKLWEEVDGVRYVGKWVVGYFFEEKGATAVIRDGTVGIAGNAFKDSTIRRVDIPASLKYCSSFAFQNCTWLSDVYISDLYAWCEIEFADALATPLSRSNGLYINGEQLSPGDTLEIPEGITRINDYAFYKQSFSSVKIPEGVTSIGKSTFEGCYNLSYVYLPEGLTEIGSQAFSNTPVSVITIPSSVTKIESIRINSS